MSVLGTEIWDDFCDNCVHFMFPDDSRVENYNGSCRGLLCDFQCVHYFYRDSA
jgi:hypothetical protein